MKKASVLILALAGAVFALGIHTCLEAGPAPVIKTDNTPLATEGQAAFTFAPVVKRVAQSVVNIYTNKSVRADQGLAPFLDDPSLRRFFGVPFEGIPRERREQALGSGVIVG